MTSAGSMLWDASSEWALPDEIVLEEIFTFWRQMVP